jgi:hypothetical protein
MLREGCEVNIEHNCAQPMGRVSTASLSSNSELLPKEPACLQRYYCAVDTLNKYNLVHRMV